MGSISATTLAFLIDWGWLRIDPYIHINIDPVLLQLGPLALRWYGLMYVVGIVMGLWFIRRYTARKGISSDQVYRVLWWCVVAGLIGARLYFVVQQPNFVSYYLAQPIHILATWEGGMAFYGAIFFVVPMLFWRAFKLRINPLVMLDAGALFAACGQIFGRIGNLINGDILGYPSTLPWSTVYDHPKSWACLDPATCGVPVQPAAGYELLLNILMIIGLLWLARVYRRPGALMATYLFGYTITQFLVFFERANIVVPLGPLDWGLKQAQWTSIIVFLVLIPLTFLVMRTRYAQPVPAGEVAATYGIAQNTSKDSEQDSESPSDISAEVESPESHDEAEPASVSADALSGNEEKETTE
ncbi:MAG TPA: prolipoprotein diacylglyceryl transferase [Ktedonobacteraceae bacterium]|nr:prolipoprotein diacylglyceryl transferase [Ktedonobacteraceae bacterium]